MDDIHSMNLIQKKFVFGSFHVKAVQIFKHWTCGHCHKKTPWGRMIMSFQLTQKFTIIKSTTLEWKRLEVNLSPTFLSQIFCNQSMKIYLTFYCGIYLDFRATRLLTPTGLTRHSLVFKHKFTFGQFHIEGICLNLACWMLDLA